MTFTAGQRVLAADLNGNTIQLIDTQTLTAPAASIVLDVPANSSYNFIKASWRLRGDSASAALQLYMRLNGDTGSNYLWEVNQANNTTVAGTTSAGTSTFMQAGTLVCASATALYFSSGVVDISGASDTTNYKVMNGSGSAFASTTNMWSGTFSGQWNSAAAVTSVTFLPQTGNFVAGSIVSLYGLS